MIAELSNAIHSYQIRLNGFHTEVTGFTGSTENCTPCDSVFPVFSV
jgi:hypothetical protein